ncbi:MAG: 50S ribosomal protein L32 [Anaerolineae bacterium]|nr:50S ribosomal protein L32 [Anaerolineae bacterium]
MGALPKRRISKGRRGHRRSHWRMKAPQLVTCPQCGAPTRPHHVCMSCGTYRGVQIIELEED